MNVHVILDFILIHRLFIRRNVCFTLCFMFKYLYWNKEQQLPKKLTIDSFRERVQDNKLYQKLNAKFHFWIFFSLDVLFSSNLIFLMSYVWEECYYYYIYIFLFSFCIIIVFYTLNKRNKNNSFKYDFRKKYGSPRIMD